MKAKRTRQGVPLFLYALHRMLYFLCRNLRVDIIAIRTRVQVDLVCSVDATHPMAIIDQTLCE
jgi:hypothetical protein